MNKKRVIIAIVFILVAIILGAFGAHGLKTIISAERIATFEVGVRYQMYAGIIILILALNEDKFNFSMKIISNLLMLGGIIFSSTLYVLSLDELTTMNLKFFGAITPIGGSLMIVSLGVFIVNLVKK